MPRSIETLLVLALLLLYPPSARGGSIEDCQSISDDESRLRCYDFAAGRNPKAEDASDNWVVRSENNPLDDTTTVIAVLSSTSGRSQWGNEPYLVARCKSDKTEVYVEWHDYLGDDDSSVYTTKKEITYRFDSHRARTELWSTSTDHTSAFAKNAIGFLRELIQSKRLVMQTTPYGANPITVIFELSGSREAIERVATTCHWQMSSSDPSKKPQVSRTKSAQPDFESVLKTVEDLKKEHEARETPEPRPEIASAAADRDMPDQPLTISELDAIRRQFISCWNVDVGAPGVENMTVSIQVELNPDDTVRQAQLTDASGNSSNPHYRNFAESALRAVRNPRCSPVKLPPKKFETMRTFTLRFSAKEMLGL